VKEEGKKQLRKLLRWLPGVLISGIAIFLVFKILDLDWQGLSAAFARIKIEYLLIGVLLFLLSLVLRALGWRTILANKVSFPSAFFTMNEGYLLNNILPFRLGEVGRALLLGRSSGLGFFHVLSTILVERMYDITISACLVLASIPFVAGATNASILAPVALALAVIIFILLFLLARNRTRVLGWFDGLEERSKFVKRFISPYLHNFINGLNFLDQWKYFLSATGWMISTWAVAFLEYYIVMKAFLPEAQLLWVTLCLGSLAIGVSIPSAPAYFGVFEMFVAGALVRFGVDHNIAFAYAVLIHFYHFLINGLLGLLGLLREGNSLSSIFSDIFRQKKTPDTIQE
jgi:uncharacterized protein (TIRG00374 family)